ncbi:MAG: glutaredoxin domain-containing protein [Myxococcaceae bacterium]
MRMTVYMKPTCGMSQRAMKLLREREIAFDTIDISKDETKRAEMIDRSGRTTTPQIFVGEYHLGGYDDLVGADANGHLDQLLEGADQMASLQP